MHGHARQRKYIGAEANGGVTRGSEQRRQEHTAWTHMFAHTRTTQKQPASSVRSIKGSSSGPVYEETNTYSTADLTPRNSALLRQYVSVCLFACLPLRQTMRSAVASSCSAECQRGHLCTFKFCPKRRGLRVGDSCYRSHVLRGAALDLRRASGCLNLSKETNKGGGAREWRAN